MGANDYSPPVSQLLAIGEPQLDVSSIDYLKLGLRAEHISDLIRMATDPELSTADSESSLVWAPVHAWRALGQLKATEAVEPLLGLLEQAYERDDEWALDELPRMLGMIGRPAIPDLAGQLRDQSKDAQFRGAVSDAFAELGKAYPQERSRCIGILADQLERFAEQDPELNAYLISALLDLEATEVAPVIERAFAANAVDEGFVDWDYTREELGLPPAPHPARPQPAPASQPGRSHSATPRIRVLSPPSIMFSDTGPSSGSRSSKTKAKRRQANKSRARNRRR